MPKLKKLSPSDELRLNKKQKTASGRKLSSNPNVLDEFNLVNSPLGKARLIPVCFSCGSSRKVTTFHAAGGVLAICEACKDGGIV